METRETLIELALAARKRVMHAAQRASAADWQDLDLTMAQLKTLLALANQSPASISQVADALEVTLPTASHLVSRLVQAGLVDRAEDCADRRRALAQLTPAGEELVLRLRQGHDRFQTWLARMDEGDLAAYARGVEALAQAAEADAARGSGNAVAAGEQAVVAGSDG